MRTFKVIAVFTVIYLALIGSASAQGTSPKGLEVPIETAAIKFASDVKDGGYKVVNTAELKKWIDEGKKFILISTLPPAEDKSFGTISSPINAEIPKTEKELTQANKDSLLKAAGSDKDQTIVLYCGFVACRRSHIGAQILTENGFKNVYRYPAGIIGWKEAGYPVTGK